MESKQVKFPNKKRKEEKRREKRKQASKARRQDAASSTGAESRWLACRPVTALTLTPMHQIKSAWISLACLSVPELNESIMTQSCVHAAAADTLPLTTTNKRKFNSISESLIVPQNKQ